MSAAPPSSVATTWVSKLAHVTGAMLELTWFTESRGSVDVLTPSQQEGRHACQSHDQVAKVKRWTGRGLACPTPLESADNERELASSTSRFNSSQAANNAATHILDTHFQTQMAICTLANGTRNVETREPQRAVWVDSGGTDRCRAGRHTVAHSRATGGSARLTPRGRWAMLP